jgi:hypothetical protein
MIRDAWCHIAKLPGILNNNNKPAQVLEDGLDELMLDLVNRGYFGDICRQGRHGLEYKLISSSTPDVPRYCGWAGKHGPNTLQELSFLTVTQTTKAPILGIVICCFIDVVADRISLLFTELYPSFQAMNRPGNSLFNVLLPPRLSIA